MKEYKMKTIIVLFAFMVYWVSCAPTTKTPFVKLDCPKTFKNGSDFHGGFFGDDKDPTLFHQCSHGQHIADFHCVNNTIFDEDLQVCVRHDEVSEHCKGKIDGDLVAYPGNPHKYIECAGGHAWILVCPSDLIFDESKKTCVYNDEGKTWPTDKPTTVTHKATTEKETERPSTPSTHKLETVSETFKTEATTVSGVCKEKELSVDPNDKHSYYVCKNGKKIHVSCPEGLEFDPVAKVCE